jgi:integrase
LSAAVVRRCACRNPDTGKRYGAACPRLKNNRHGSWQFVVDVPGPGGKRRQVRRAGFETAAAARTARNEVLARVRLGIRVDRSETVGQYLESWLSGRRALKPTTRRSYAGHIERLLVPQLGHLRLEDLRPEHISDAYQRIIEENAALSDLPARQRGGRRPMGPLSLRRVHATLHKALADAVKSRRLAHNPAQYVELPTATRRRVQPWTPIELGRFLQHAQGDRLGALFELAANGGLRRGELCGLRWVDVDLDAGLVTVRQQLVQDGAKIYIDTPKTAAGEHRRVDLDDMTVRALYAWRGRQDLERLEAGPGWTDTDLVFTREDGTPLRPEFVTKHFTRLARDLGLPAARLHDLRHAAASLQIAAGVPLAVISKRLGHSSINVTVDIYGHLLEGAGRQAANAAAALIPRSPDLLGDGRVTTELPIGPMRVVAEAADDVLTSEDVGGPRGDRTHNPRIKSPLLCQLS